MSGPATREARPDAPRGAAAAAGPDLATPGRGATSPADRSRRVFDADPDRAGRTELLLHSLADRLGLRVDSIRVHVDEEAVRETRPRGARGLMLAGTVWLDPDRYDPRTADGRGCSRTRRRMSCSATGSGRTGPRPRSRTPSGKRRGSRMP